MTNRRWWCPDDGWFLSGSADCPDCGRIAEGPDDAPEEPPEEL